jgi:hypothetical protein
MFETMVILMLKATIDANRKVMAVFLFEHNLKKIIVGISFCHVIRSIIEFHESVFPIFTIHPSNGNIPIFSTTDIIASVFALLTIFCSIVHELKKMYVISSKDERVWNRKNTNTFSFLFSANRNMINPTELISIIIQ